MLRKIINTPERGSVAVELVILVPALALVAVFLFGAGRIATAENAIQSAANAGAREASLARTTDQAQANALEAAHHTITQDGYKCADFNVIVNDDGLNAPLGEIGTVSITITCELDLTDLGVDFLGPTKKIEVTATSPVDPFRERPE